MARIPAAVLIVLLATSCGGPDAAFNSVLRDYIRLAAALGDRDMDSLDFYYGPPIHQSDPSFRDIQRSATELAGRLEGRQDLRSSRLQRQLKALAARADVLASKNPASKMTFDEELSVYFGLKLPEAPEGRDEIRAQIDKLLPGKGSLAERYAGFDAKFIIPPDKLPTVMARAMQGCRAQTLPHLRLSAGESVTLTYVGDKPWSGFSHYQGNFHSLIEINADLALTVDRALQLACHEGYPGHHAFNVMQDVQLVRDRKWLEWTVQPTFSPQSLVSEAMATYAIDMAFPGQERVRFERDALFPLAGLNAADVEKYIQVERLVDQLQGAIPYIARDYLDGKLEWVRAGDALEKQVLMTHPEATLKYFNEYRSYVVTYTWGRDRIAEMVDGWLRYQQLMTDPNAAALMTTQRRTPE